MKKLFLLFLLLPSFVLAQNTRIGGEIVAGGLRGVDPANDFSFDYALNTAGQRIAYGFHFDEDCTINAARLYMGSVTGTLAAADIKLAIQGASATGLPSGTDLQEVNCSAIPSANATNEWTGLTVAATRGTQYFAILRNANGVPASNFINAKRWGGGGAPHDTGLGSDFQGWNTYRSSDSGATWPGTGVKGNMVLRIQCSNGKYVGLPLETFSANGPIEVHSTREVGARFTVPATDPTWRVRCLTAPVGHTGTAPAGGSRFGIRIGASPGAATYTSTNLNLSDSLPRWRTGCFSAVQTLAPGTVVNLVVGAVSGGSSGNNYRVPNYTIQNNANTKALMPFGSWTTVTYDGTTWTNTDTTVIPFGVIFDNQAFTASAGGLKNLNTTSGGAQ